MTFLPSFPSLVTATTDHADPGMCAFHSSVPIGAAPCPVCMTAKYPSVRRPAPAAQISSGESGGQLVIKASSIEDTVFFLHGGITAPTAPESGDLVNDHRE